MEDHSIFTDLTRKYEDRFMQDVRDFNVLDPDELIRVKQSMALRLSSLWVGLFRNSSLILHTSLMARYILISRHLKLRGNTYTRLEPWNRSNQPLSADGEGALTKKVAEKRSRADFALWKASQPGEPSWPSPWGRGRPGWHIERSAMASDTLGK